MRVPTTVYVMLGVAVTLGVSVPSSISAQVPRPRVAVPAGEGVIQTADPAPAPAAQAPGQPTVAPAAAAPTQPAPVSAAPPPSGVTQLPAAAPPATASSSAAATAKRAYSTANFSLNLDGVNAGFLQAVEGGAAVGNVVVENVGPDNIRKKHVAGVKYEELSFDVGLESKPVIEWITSAWQGKYVRKNGSVQIADHNFNIIGERQFTDALITGTTISALDASEAKSPVFLTVTVAPESVREMAGSGKTQSPLGKGPKRWLSSNFRFEMGDLETSFVKRVEPFTVGQKVTEDDVGERRVAEKQPNTLEFPNLKVTMAARPSPNWDKWREEFLIKGSGGEAQEKNGAIVFLDQTLKNELGRINLFNCGIFRLGADRQEASKEKASTVTADLYCERMELAIKS